MRDFQIRQVLRKTELAQFITDNDSKVVEELKIPLAKARIDIAVINGAFHGYEIKSARDTLSRLPNQLIAYSLIFDYLTIITEERHVSDILNFLDPWVGVAICTENAEYIIKRQGEPNLNKNGFHIAKLLWHSELIEVLSDLQIKFRKNDRNWLLCKTLSSILTVDDLSDIVRQKLKSRECWRVLL